MQRAVITRFLACGRDRKQYTILRIRQEEQVNFGLRLNQKTVAGTVQNLTLVSIAKAATPIKLQNPKNIQDLSYTFDPQEQKLQKQGKIPHAYDDVLNDNDSNEQLQSIRRRNDQSSEDQDQDSDEQNQNQQWQGQNQQNQNQQDENQEYENQQYRSSKSKSKSKHGKSRRPRSVNSNEQDSSEESDENNSNEYRNYETDAEGKGQLAQPSLKDAPLNPLLVSPLRTSGMKKRVQDLMKEIVEDITTDKQSMAQSETVSKISTVAKILRFLNYNAVEELYNKVADKRWDSSSIQSLILISENNWMNKMYYSNVFWLLFSSQTEEDQTSRNVFLDAVAIAGTNPCIKFLIDLIEKKQLTGEHAAQIIMTFPMYVRTPTQALLKEIYVSLHLIWIQLFIYNELN